jgi:3-methylfumaryl-CoA hydratase
MEEAQPNQNVESAVDIDYLKGWIGRRDRQLATITSTPSNLLAAVLNKHVGFAFGDPLPPLWHWAHFTPCVRSSELGTDGHPKRGGFLPPVQLPRRMWAGGRLRFFRALRVGEEAIRETEIQNVSLKPGRHGALVVITLLHRVLVSDELVIEEEQDLVYHSATTRKPTSSSAERSISDYSVELIPNAVLLFRYSALTFNAHRIHYDLSYAQQEEKYADLVVQGPLTATMLMDSVAAQLRRTTQVRTFAFRGISPLFVNQSLRLCGRREGSGAELWAEGPGGRLAMTARASFRD